LDRATVTEEQDGRQSDSGWLDRKVEQSLQRVNALREEGGYPYFRPFESGGIRTTVGGHAIVNFSSNDYLGLTNDPAVLAAAQEAVGRFGMGLSSSRLQANTVAHAALETRLARFFGFEAALITTTGYQAMVSLLSAIADGETTLALDSLAHACILDGSFMAAGVPGQAAEVRFFNHNSARSLERVLSSRQRPNAIVAVEGVYSLDGDLGKLSEILEVCDRHGAVAVLDDAHGSGTLGANGRGTLEHLGLEGRVPLVVTTFSKSFGGIGGVILGPADVLDMVRHTARAFLFSASLPVPVLAAADAILGRLEAEGPVLVGELQAKARYLRQKLDQAAFEVGGSPETQIAPILVREERAVIAMHHALYQRGFYLVPITYPGVKRGEERLRLNVTRGHTYAELDALVAALSAARSDVGAFAGAERSNSVPER
jgi:glycine C-acetyltransferase